MIGVATVSANRLALAKRLILWMALLAGMGPCIGSLLGGCQACGGPGAQRPAGGAVPAVPPALAGERFSGAHRATPLFNPASSAAYLPGVPGSPAAAYAPAAALPPMEWFNWRAAWPAAGPLELGEITFYRERYYDWQTSTTGGQGYINDYLQRNFEFYRVGTLVR